MNNMLPESWKRPIEDIQGSIAHPIAHLRSHWPWHRREDDTGWPAIFEAHGGPAVEVTEDSDAIIVKAELPGLEKDDFEVEIEGDRLVIRGEKRAEKEEKKKGYYYTERSFGSFYRAIPLACDVDTKSISADYEKGILTVTLAKTEEAKAKRITVDVK